MVYKINFVVNNIYSETPCVRFTIHCTRTYTSTHTRIDFIVNLLRTISEVVMGG
jgi:hypothetical protein